MFLTSIVIVFIWTTVSTDAISLDDTAPRWFFYCHFQRGEHELDILSCNRCLEFGNVGQLCDRYSNANYTTSTRLSPILENTWFHENLYSLISAGNILSNLEDLNSFAPISNHLFTILLNNMGIQEIRSGAFERFYLLKVLNLANNNIKHIELSVFSYVTFSPLWTNETFNNDTELVIDAESNLIELDLSFNKISVVRMESNTVLRSLRVFNLSNNYAEAFDLRFFAIIAPRLEVIDLGSNYLRSFKVFNDYLAMNSLAKLSSKPYSLIKNLIASNLIDLNLNE